jgi:hypothetical protein
MVKAQTLCIMDSKEEVFVECGSCSFRLQTVLYMAVVSALTAKPSVDPGAGLPATSGQWELRNGLLK